MKITLAAAVSATLMLTLATGCRVSSEEQGDKKNVSIATPFGSMHVNTDEKPDTTSIGLAVYPGATPYKDPGSDHKDSGSADINMSFGDFHLGVKAATFITPDSQDKVLAFYKKELAKYGDVITCRGDSTLGEPTRTAQGLTCDEDKKNHVTSSNMDSGDLELRAGSQQHQHVVGVEDKSGKTKIGLVALDLPVIHDKKDVE
ncbi:hypothetical protein [Bryocella elongata]|nr:hypothetical protein [Bryocella elongata]